MLLALLAAAAQGAEVYRSNNPDGTVTYSDRPTNANSELVTSVQGERHNAPAGPRAAGPRPSAAQQAAAARNAALVHDLDPDAKDLEGYLFPETYSLSHKADATTLVAAMVDRFHKMLTPELRDAAAARQLTVRQLVTLASIVEKETAKADERPLVASVYTNRLRIGMPLQCDPTVIFALLRVGRYNGNLRRDDLQFDSPYNTYRYPGMPPGPIAAPGAASLRAAANPASTEYLYFVSRNDGSHVFSPTLSEHNRNVQTFQVEYFRQKRLQERRAAAAKP